MSVYRPRGKDGSFKSPFWHYDFEIKVDGQRIRFHGSTGETAKARAREAEAAEKRRQRAGKPNDGLTLAAACMRYCDEIAASQASADDTATALEHCCRLIGNERRLASITANDIADAVRRRSAESYGRKNPRLVSPATVNRQIVEPMRRLMRRARQIWGVSIDLDALPWGDLMLREPPGRMREFSAEEAGAFWAALRPDYAPIVWFLAHRGFRVRAVLAMVRKQVDLDGLRVQVWRKGVGFAWRPLSPSQAAVVQTEMKKAPLAAVWTYEAQRGPKRGTRRPITYNGLRRVIGRTLQAADIDDFRIHDLRHDFASKLLRKTRDLAMVQKALDHATITSTMRYAHVLDEDISAGMELLSRNSPGIVETGQPKKQAK